MDWFEITWNEWVINYDFVHQIVLAQNHAEQYAHVDGDRERLVL